MTRPRTAVAWAVSLMLVGGCAGSGAPEDLGSFCDGAASLADGSVLAGVDLTDLASLSSEDPALAAAITSTSALRQVAAPQEVADEWLAVVEPLVELLAAARAADLSSASARDDLRARADALATPETVRAGEAVDAYVAEHC